MMSAIETVLRQPAAQVMGWALLHFMWQGALIGVLTAAALAMLRQSAADVRYVVATIAMSLMLTMPVMTAVQTWGAASAAGGTLEAAACSSSAQGCFGPASTGEGVTQPQRSISPGAGSTEAGHPRDASARAAVAAWPAAALDRIQLESWLPIVVLGWLCGVAVLTLRLMSGWLWVQRMKSHGAVAADEGWQFMAARLSRRLHIGRRVRLLQSTLVDVPTVIGWIKPVVLLPASALAGLTPHQLEAILAHELAHIRRHDYLVNLLQTAVETLLFYHPAVWWLSRRIRIERENCCDDLAVSLCGDPYTYAKALADLEELRGASGQLVMAASGGSLVQRVRRLLGAPTHAGRGPGWLAGSATIVVMLGIVGGAVGRDTQSSSSKPPQRPVAASPVVAADEAARSAQAAVLASEPMAAAAARLAEADSHMQRARETAVVASEAPSSHSNTQAVLANEDALRGLARSMAAQVAALDNAGESTAKALSALDSARSSSLFEIAAPALPALAATPPSRASTAAAAAQHSHGTMSWSVNGDKLEVKYDGEMEFTDDDTDVKKMSPGGTVRIRDGGLLAAHTIEFTADAAGNITRKYWVGSSERPFEPEGREFLARLLPRVIRQTGFGAPARVARILKAKGPSGVLAEIGLIEGSWAKHVYFKELLKTATLDPAMVRQVLQQAGREVDSDFELASLLIDSADKLMVDEGTRQAYFEAARSISSDFEMRRVYSEALKRGPVSAAVLAGILEASRTIESDFEEASLLIQIAKLQALDNTSRAPFFSALATVDSDFEHHRVLTAVAERGDLGPETTTAMLASGASVQSDFESASFLAQLAKQQPIEGPLRTPFFKTLDAVDSSFERGRVLKAVLARPTVSDETILSVLRSTGAISSSFEASQVLLAIAQGHTLTGAARDAYIAAADKLGDFEQGQVLAALVRSDRRK